MNCQIMKRYWCFACFWTLVNLPPSLVHAFSLNSYTASGPINRVSWNARTYRRPCKLWINPSHGIPKQSLASIDEENANEDRKCLELYQGRANYTSWNITNHEIEQFVSLVGMQTGYFSSWSSYQEVAFLRWLGSRRAYGAVLAFVERVAKRNVFVWTAAISVLSESDDHRDYCFSLLQRMGSCSIRPSPYTFSALFEACSDASDVILLAELLDRNHTEVSWTIPVYEAALYACVPRDVEKCSGLHNATSSAFVWDVVKSLIERLERHNGKTMTPTVFVALLCVCSYTQTLPKSPENFLIRVITNSKMETKMTSRLWLSSLQICAAAGDDRQALEILKLMTSLGWKPSVRHGTAYLNSLIKLHKIKEAIDFLYVMARKRRLDGVVVESGVDKVALHTVLRASVTSDETRDIGFQLLARIQEGDFGPGIHADEECYNILLAACREPKEAKNLIRQMHLTRRHRIGAVHPSRFSYTRAITVCRTAKDVETARFFLDDARRYGVQPDLYMYTAAIWAAADSGDAEGALSLMGDMKNNGCAPNVVSYNGVIAAYAKKGMALQACQIYDEIKEIGLASTRTTFIQLALCIEKRQDVEERIIMLENIFKKVDMNDEWKSACPIVESLINAYGSRGRYHDALNVFNRIEGHTDTRCLRAITSLCTSMTPPPWEDAISIIHSSDIVDDESACRVDQVALGHVMLACSKAGKWEESLQLFRFYGSYNTPLAAVNSLIACCGRIGRTDMAIEILNEMEAYGVKPNSRTYRNVIIACNQAEHEQRREVATIFHEEKAFQWWECAMSLLRRMKEEGLQPDIQTYSSVISACEAASKWQRALSVLQSMMNDSYTEESLNLYCFNAAIAACAKGGAWVEAVDLFERMKQKGESSLRPTIVTYGSLIEAVDTAGQKELAMSLYDEALRKRIVQPWRTTRSNTGDHVIALDFHHFTTAMSRAAIRSYMDTIMSGQQQVPVKDLIIVVGKGLRSSGEPVLMKAVTTVLLDEYGILATIDLGNTGRIVVPSEHVRAMLKKNSW